MNINGLAHIALNVADLKKSKLFYDKILTNMGLSLIHSSSKSFYYVGGKTGILIQQANVDKIKNPIIKADIRIKYILSFKIITASIVTIKGTIKCIALNCSNEIYTKDPKPRYMIGKFIIPRRRCNLR